MASIIRDFAIAAPADSVWSALRNFYAVHQRVAPGFVVELKQDNDIRVVNFANGLVAQERFVASDDTAMRLSYTSVHGRAEHHNASVQVFSDGQNSHIVWITDVLPDTLAGPIGGMMDIAIPIMQKTLSASSIK